ncbi:MAG: ABC transporter substrate-binding protein [Burkholderiales bacterium]|nr:ABC transporter substrate-binding protein [Burkholderiales bacterium]
MTSAAVGVDAIGLRHARFHSPARLRIACLVPSITETLFALGLGDRVVARTGFCIHPEPAVREVPKVGGTKDVNLARLLATEPTHVIVNIDENRKDAVDQIRRAVPNVIVTHPVRPEDNVALFALFGYVFSADAAAAALTRDFADALDTARAVGAQADREPVLYLIWKQPWMTVSRDTYVSAMLATVGWSTLPAQAERRYPELDADDAAWRDAARILLSSEPYPFAEDHVQALREAAPNAPPVALVDGEMTSWYGVRAIAGLRYLARLRQAEALTLSGF